MWPTISFDVNSSLVKWALGDLCPLIKPTSIHMRPLNTGWLAPVPLSIFAATQHSLCRQAPTHATLHLQINVADVESWVVRAVSSGLIDARMDQQSHSLSILRTVQREFNAGQWKELQKKLHSWRDSVASMSNTLERKA